MPRVHATLTADIYSATCHILFPRFLLSRLLAGLEIHTGHKCDWLSSLALPCPALRVSMTPSSSVAACALCRSLPPIVPASVAALGRCLAPIRPETCRTVAPSIRIKPGKIFRAAIVWYARLCDASGVTSFKVTATLVWLWLWNSMRPQRGACHKSEPRTWSHVQCE